MRVAIVFKFGQPKGGTSGVIKTRVLYLADSYKPDNCKEGWKGQKISFESVCFKTSKWVYQQLHQVAAYIKCLGIVL